MSQKYHFLYIVIKYSLTKCEREHEYNRYSVIN